MVTQSRWRGELSHVEVAQRIAEAGQVRRGMVGGFTVRGWPGVKGAEYTPGKFRLWYADGTEREWTWEQMAKGKEGKLSQRPSREVVG